MKFEREVDRQIRRAMEAGGFDDLPGRGRPQDLSENPLENPDQRLAFHVLKMGNVAPDWIQLGNEIESTDDAIRRDIERHRRQMREARDRLLSDPDSDLRRQLRTLHGRHRRFVEGLRERLIESRRRTERFNYLAPDPAAKVAIQVEPTLRAIDRTWPWPDPRD